MDGFRTCDCSGGGTCSSSSAAGSVQGSTKAAKTSGREGEAEGGSGSADPFSSSVAVVEGVKPVARNRKRGTTSATATTANSPGADRKKQKMAEEKEKNTRLDGIKISSRTARMSTDNADVDMLDESLKEIEVSAGLGDKSKAKSNKKKMKKQDDEDESEDPDICDFRQMSGDGVRKVMKTYGIRKSLANNKEEEGGMQIFDVLIQLVE